MVDFIPVDNIPMEYAICGDDKKVAVTNVIRSSSYISASMDSDGEATLTWKANPAISLHLILGIIQIGGKEYGDTWLSELKSKLSQTE